MGYRVWKEVYSPQDNIVTICLDEGLMKEKEQMLLCYELQIQDPAFPHEHHDFIELMKIANKKMARHCKNNVPYAESFKLLSID